MRVAGINIIAVAIAAIAFYMVGFVFYGLLFSEAWMTMAGFTEDDFAGQEWRLALGPVMPIVMSAGLAWLFKLAPVAGAVPGAMRAVIVGAVFAVPPIAYDVAYGLDSLALLALDGAHLITAFAVAGAIVGAWRSAPREAQTSGSAD